MKKILDFFSNHPYFVSLMFILGWWSFAFHTPPTSPPFPLLTSVSAPQLPTLSHLERFSLQKALLGDFDLMLQFIKNWNTDASVLERSGVKAIKKLSTKKLLQAHDLYHLIHQSSPQNLKHLNRMLATKHLVDGSEALVEIPDLVSSLLPQTYMAATFLLAIADPQEILAIPRGMRELTQLYPSPLLDLIPKNIQYYQGEKLYLASPSLAFISLYSHPPSLEAMRRQGIPFFVLSTPNNLTDIFKALRQVGHASQHVLEARLLHIFMEAAFLMIDNRLQTLHSKADHLPLQMLLYLYCEESSYKIPTLKSLSGQLLQRALHHNPSFISPWLSETDFNWRLPFEQEKIRQTAPDCLILAHRQSKPSLNVDYFQGIPACEKQKLFYIDETVQESPTQFIVLAYFDLFQILATAQGMSQP